MSFYWLGPSKVRYFIRHTDAHDFPLDILAHQCFYATQLKTLVYFLILDLLFPSTSLTFAQLVILTFASFSVTSTSRLLSCLRMPRPVADWIIVLPCLQVVQTLQNMIILCRVVCRLPWHVRFPSSIKTTLLAPNRFQN